MDPRISYGSAYYCDIGPHAGMMAVPLKATVYMTHEEYRAYLRSGVLRVQIAPLQDAAGAAQPASLSAAARLALDRARHWQDDAGGRTGEEAAAAILAAAGAFGYLAGLARAGQPDTARHGYLLYEMCATARELAAREGGR